MNKKIICLLLALYIGGTSLFSQEQNLEELQLEELFFKFRPPTPENVKFVNGVETKRILNFNREFLELFPDTLKNPDKIKFISVEYNSANELEKNIEALKAFPNLEYLEIKTTVQFRKSHIKDTLVISENIASLQKLKYLQLSGTYHLNYNDIFFKLLTLTSLDYLGLPNDLDEVLLPPSFLNFDNLKGIKISGFKKYIFPPYMGGMKNLESIVMPTEAYEDIGEELLKFASLPEFKNLALQYVNLKEKDLYPFRSFSKLEKVILSIVEIEDVQDLVNNFSKENSIKELSLQNLKSNNGISDYSKLTKLEKLHISSYNGYKISLNESLYDLENLKSLTIRTDSLFSLSERLGNLKNLEKLNFSYNNITSLPESIGELKKLKHLDLAQNNIASLPISISGLTALERLNLNNNSLNELSYAIGNLSNLTSLRLNNNYLAELPTKIGNLINLETLSLSINYLKALPEDFGNLKALERLNLDDNFLSKLPDSFSQLNKLRYLHLSFNKLQELPEDFGNLNVLEEIYLGGNRNISKPPSYHPSSGIKIKESRPERVFNEIKLFPQSFSTLKNLNRVDLRGMETLEGEALFDIFFQIPSKGYQLNLSKTGITFLPKNGWKNFLASSLNMGGNIIDHIPSAIVDAPYLTEFIFKLSKKDGMSNSLRGRAELNAFFEEQGFINFDSLPRTEEMAKAYLENAYDRTYIQGDNILELMDKAFLIDSAYTEKNIRNSTYADELLKGGKYQKAITYYDRAIERDTARGPYILNFILPNFRNRATAHLAVGDTLAAIKGLEYVSMRFNSGDWVKAGILANSIDKDSLAFQYFESGEKFYKNYIKTNEKEGKMNYGYQLSLLELYIVQEDHSKVLDYINLLETDSISQMDKKLLFEYLKQIVIILQNNVVKEDLNDLKERVFIADVKFSSWSFDLLKLWLQLSDVDEEKKEMISGLTEAMQIKS